MNAPVVGEYQCLVPIASGSQSQLWEARHPAYPETVALKVMLPAMLEDRAAVQAMRHEAQVASQLEHPNTIAIYEFHASRTEAYIAMEYFRAPNVKAQLQTDLDALHRRLPRVVEGTCLALDHMHALGWVHKDVKPDNVLCNKAGEVKLIDFSLAAKAKSGFGKLLGGKEKTIQGTRTYIAPETILKQAPTPATDVYSFGVMMFEILTGDAPFKGASPNDLLKRHLNERPPEPSSRNPNVTPELDRVVVRLMAKKPEDRPQTMGEVYHELRGIPFFKEAIGSSPKPESESTDDPGIGARLDSRADAQRQAAAGPRAKRPAPATPPASTPNRRPLSPPRPRPPRPRFRRNSIRHNSIRRNSIRHSRLNPLIRNRAGPIRPRPTLLNTKHRRCTRRRPTRRPPGSLLRVTPRSRTLQRANRHPGLPHIRASPRPRHLRRSRPRHRNPRPWRFLRPQPAVRPAGTPPEPLGHPTPPPVRAARRKAPPRAGRPPRRISPRKPPPFVGHRLRPPNRPWRTRICP